MFEYVKIIECMILWKEDEGQKTEVYSYWERSAQHNKYKFEKVWLWSVNEISNQHQIK